MTQSRLGPTAVLILLALTAGAATPVKKHAQQDKQEPKVVYTNCTINGTSGNPDGFMTTYEDYQCAEGVIRLKGKWGQEIQGQWKYDTQLGRISRGEYVGGVSGELLMPKFQIWEPTAHGYKLTGWNEAYDQKERLEDQERSKCPKEYEK